MPTMVVERRSAHEAVVAMMSMITSGKSEGPLGVRGHGMYEGLGYCLNWLQDLVAKPSHTSYDEARGKPAEGKAMGDGSARHFQLDWGNLAVQDDRGDERNLTILGFREW